TGPVAPGSVSRSRPSSTGGDSAGPPVGRSSSSRATAGSAPGSTSSRARCVGCARSPTASSGPTPMPARTGTRRSRQGYVPCCRTATASSPGTRCTPSTSSRRWSSVRDVLGELLAWWREGEPVAMGTVVATWRSSPRQPGAAMLVGPGGEAVGSVSGGCVEGAVYAVGEEVLESGVPDLQRYGVSDDDAAAVGLTCGGILDVYVEEISPATFPELADVAADIEHGRPVAVATVIEHPDAAWVGRRMVVRPEEHTGVIGSDRAY